MAKPYAIVNGKKVEPLRWESPSNFASRIYGYEQDDPRNKVEFFNIPVNQLPVKIQNQFIHPPTEAGFRLRNVLSGQPQKKDGPDWEGIYKAQNEVYGKSGEVIDISHDLRATNVPFLKRMRRAFRGGGKET